MSPPTNLRGLIGDTSFWIEAFDPTGEHHAAAVALLEDLRKHVILMPWPIMYEVLRTRTVRNFNPADLDDVCRVRGVDLWPYPS